MASSKNGSGEVNIGPAYEKEVEIELDTEAIEDRKKKLVEVDNRLVAAEAAKSEAMREHNAELKDIRKERLDCLAAINSGKTTQLVKVEDHMIFRTQSVVTKRKDTGEVVDERPMTAEERQTKMFAEPEKGNDGSSATVGDIAAARSKKTKKRGKKAAGKNGDQPQA